MRKILVTLCDEREMSIPELFLTGMSFSIRRELHLWPSLPTMNAFLAGGIDDVPNEIVAEWDSFSLGESEYADAMASVDPQGAVDTLGVGDGDWRAWFTKAVLRVRGEA